MENCLVVGDSFVKHLREFNEQKFSSGCLFVHGAWVEVWGESGAAVSRIGDCLVDIPFGRYSVIVIACGSNDLCRQERTEETVADDLLSLSRFLVTYRGVQRVVVCELLPRYRANRHFEVTLADFNRRVVQTNDMLKLAIAHSQFPIVFWRHDCRVRSPGVLKPDGTHLNDRGLRFFENSVYRAVWSQLRIVLGIDR